VQGDGQLDHAQVRAEVAAGTAARLDQPLADFGRECRQRRFGQRTYVGWPGDLIQQRHGYLTRQWQRARTP
jgi:hypothetical protein